MTTMERRISRAEQLLGTGGDGRCRCPDREPWMPFGHVDSRGVLWHVTPDTCPDCGGSTVATSGERLVIIRMGDHDGTSLEELPFGGYDRWAPWGPPKGRQEEISPTGVADEVERPRIGADGWSHLTFVPIAELMGTER